MRPASVTSARWAGECAKAHPASHRAKSHTRFSSRSGNVVRVTEPTESTIRPRDGEEAEVNVRPLTGPIDLSQINLELTEGRREARDGLIRFLMPYKFAIEEVMTKLRILQEEFTQTGEYNPIEHMSSRLKDRQHHREDAASRSAARDRSRARDDH